MQTLVRNFAIARKNLAAYPPGHPAVVGSVAAAHRRLVELVAAGGKLTLGVTRDALVFGDETLSFVHARDFAQSLYRRAVAAVRIEPGVEAAELESFLRLLGAEATGKDGPPLAQELAAAGIRHIHLDSVDYSAVTVTEELTASAKAGPRSLWEDILRAMLSGDGLSAESRKMVEAGGARSAPAIAALLREASAGAAARRADLAALVAQAVGRHLAAATPAERLLAVKQVAELVRAIPPEMKDTLLTAALKALASEESAADALQALASLSAPDAVLRVLRGMKDEMPLSSHALRLMQTLSAYAAPAERAAGDEAQQTALLAEMTEFFREDDIDRYNPDDHKALLENISLGLPAGTGMEEVAAEPGDRLESLGDEATTESLALTTLELLAAHGPRNGFEPLLTRAQTLFRGFVTTGRLEPAVVVAERMQDLAAEIRFDQPFRARIAQAVAEMTDAESVSAMLDALYRRGPGAAALARRLIDALGATVGRTFLVALAEETDKSKRHRLLEVLVSLGPSIVPEAMRLLADERWYVVRNMVLILHRVGDPASVQAVRDAAEHPDLRVRLEAIKGLLKLDLETARGMLARAIHDPDPKLAETAIGLAGTYAIAEAVEPLLGIVDQWDVFGRQRALRLKALRALGDLADPAALPRLERFFKNWLVPVVALEERRAAYRALQSYPVEARREIVQRGLHSRDDEIRALCRRLQTQGPARGQERAQRG